MFAAWVAQLDDLDVPGDTESVSAAVAGLSVFQAKLAVAVSALEVSGDWELDGSTSITAWLKGRGLTAGDAGQLAAWAKRSRALPVLFAAWTAGRLSLGQVKTILANVRDRHVNLFAEHETDLIPLLEQLDIAETQVAMMQWRLKAEALDDHPTKNDVPCTAHLTQTLDGRWYLNGAFGAEPGAVIDTAMRVAASTSDWSRIPAERRADALVDICRRFLDTQDTFSGRRHRPHLNVVVDGASLTGAGHVTGHLTEQLVPLDSATLTRLLCDCTLHRVLQDQKGAILDYGHAVRNVTGAMFNALAVRDRGCRFKGCDRPADWSEAHHIKWFSNGGPTDLNNLVLMCSRHHHLLHKPGWHAEARPDGSVIITGPGHTHTSYPRLPLAS